MKFFSKLRALYHHLIKLADTKQALPVLALLSFTESCVFVIPPETLLVPMGAANPKRAINKALFCSLFSLLGAYFAYFLGYYLWQNLESSFIPGLFSQEKFDYVHKLFQEHATLSLFMAAFTPIPFKVFTLAAGVFKINFWLFFVVISFARTLRYVLIGALFYFFGTKIKDFIEKYFEVVTIVGTICLLAIIYIFKI